MYKIISQRVLSFKRLVGVSLVTFKEMVEVVRVSEELRLNGETRGRDEELSLEDQTLLTMMYLRSYTTYLFLGGIFQVSESNACRKSKKIEDILIKSGKFSLPKKAILQNDLDTIIFDATEVQIERPSRKQRGSYSGKKKRHTNKVQVIISGTGQILKTDFAKGKVHDKKLFDKSKLMISKKTKKLGDSGYQGVQKDMQNVDIPKKASKKHPLTKEDKSSNHELSKKRILVENKLCQIKVFDIFDEKYRNKGRRFGLRFNLVCGIVNHNNGFKNK